MKTIYLIRHSMPLRPLKVNNEFNNDNLQMQNEKSSLSIEGEQIAKDKLNNKEFANNDILFSSSYVRAIQTAKYISEKNNLEINVISDFGEKQFLDGNYNVIENDCLNQYIKDYIPNFNKENLENYLKKFVLKSNYE